MVRPGRLSATIEQENGIPEKGIPPLNWWGSDLAKIDALAHTFVKRVENAAPNLRHLRYDFAKQSFVRNSDSGRDSSLQEASDSVVESRNDGGSVAGRVRPSGVGKASGRAAILIKSLVSGESGTLGDDGILEAVLNRSRSLVGEGDLAGMFSRGNYADEEANNFLRNNRPATPKYVCRPRSGRLFCNRVN